MNNIKRTTRTETTHTESTVVETVDEDESGTLRQEPVPHKRIHPATAWHHLQTFFIEYPPAAGTAIPQVKVFANDRQQVRIRMVLSPRDANGAYVAVPVDELRGMLRLVDYNTGLPLPSGWTVERAANGYTHDTSVISSADGKSDADYPPHDNRAESGALANDQVAVDLFVRTKVANSAVRIAASILPPGGSQPIQTRPGAAGNQFDSSVNVDARPPLYLSLDNFRVREGYYNHDHLSWFTVTNRFITVEYQSRRIRLLRVENAAGVAWGAGINIYGDNGDFDANGWEYEGMFTICAKSPTLTYYFDIPNYFDNHAYVYDKLGGVQDYEAGAILFLLHYFDENQHFRWSTNWGDPSDVLSRNVILVDEYGNSHKVRIGVPRLGLQFQVLGTW